jgi:hypothetical protein
VARMGEKGNAFMLLVGKLEGRRPLGRPRHRWVDNIRIDLGEVGWGDVDWICLANDGNIQTVISQMAVRLSALSTSCSCEFGIEPLGSMKCFELSSSLASSGLSSSAQLHRVS